LLIPEELIDELVPEVMAEDVPEELIDELEPEIIDEDEIEEIVELELLVSEMDETELELIPCPEDESVSGPVESSLPQAKIIETIKKVSKFLNKFIVSPL